MKYENARDILPANVLKQVQKYTQGTLIYIPSDGTRKPWGEASGYKHALSQRNRDIRNKFVEGASADELAAMFYLAPETIKKIVYTKKESDSIMKKLPEIMPSYTIEKSQKPVFEVKCESLRGWEIVPRLNETASFARYVYPQKTIRDVVDLKVVGKAEIHGIDCVRIEAHQYSTAYQPDSYDSINYLAAQLTENHSRLLAEWHEEGGIFKQTTFMDGDTFFDIYGCGENNMGREIYLTPKQAIIKNDNKITVIKKDPFYDVVGRYTVTINNKPYDTILVVDTESFEDGIITEEYIDENGKSVLFRRYNRNDWYYDHYGKLWEELLPDADRIIVNEQLFVHWVDSISTYVS